MTADRTFRSCLLCSVCAPLPIHLFQEPEEFLRAMPPLARAKHLAGGDVQRRKQRSDAVADVIMGLALGQSWPQRQQGAGAVQSLHLALLIHAEYHLDASRPYLVHLFLGQELGIDGVCLVNNGGNFIRRLGHVEEMAERVKAGEAWGAEDWSKHRDFIRRVQACGVEAVLRVLSWSSRMV